MKRFVDDAPANAQRRSFLLGAGAFLALPMPTLSVAIGTASSKRMGYSRAVFQQQAYFDSGIDAESYERPAVNSATRDYVANLSHEEFLRRHWFT